MTPFMRGLLRQRPAVIAWVGVLVLVNGVAPLFFLQTLEAKVVLATLAAGGVLMELLTWWQGFTRLLGFGHVLWLGLVPWLLTRLGQYEAGPVFSWLVAVVVFNALSLVLDARDVALYLGGAREEQLPPS